MPIVSIVIPNYNYGFFADAFFHSLAAQTFPLANIEIIFVDDGSTDDSIVNAHQWAEKLQCDRFVIETPARSGKPGLVRNHGLSMADGNYLLCLDPDDTLHPEFLATCISTLDNNKKIDLVYTDYQEIHPDKISNIALPDYNPTHLRTQNPLPPTALYRRSIWDNGIRYRDNTTYEDWDYWIQCAIVGAKFHHIPHVLYNYRFHEKNYSHYAISKDGPAKAQIVLNNPEFFHQDVREWAINLSRNRPYSQPFRRGYIPTPNDLRALLKLTTGNTSGQSE